MRVCACRREKDKKGEREKERDIEIDDLVLRIAKML